MEYSNIMYVAVALDGKYFNIVEDWCHEGYNKVVEKVESLSRASLHTLDELNSYAKEYLKDSWLFTGDEFLVSKFKKLKVTTIIEEEI